MSFSFSTGVGMAQIYLYFGGLALGIFHRLFLAVLLNIVRLISCLYPYQACTIALSGSPGGWRGATCRGIIGPNRYRSVNAARRPVILDRGVRACHGETGWGRADPGGPAGPMIAFARRVARGLRGHGLSTGRAGRRELRESGLSPCSTGAGLIHCWHGRAATGNLGGSCRMPISFI